MNRCGWARDDLSIRYHDEEWGVPVHDDRLWFEFLILEGAQAGLSWDTVLRKREHYRRVFAGFDRKSVSRFEEPRIESLLADPGIVRNRLKVTSAVRNARAFLKVQHEFGSFDKFIWGFVSGYFHWKPSNAARSSPAHRFLVFPPLSSRPIAPGPRCGRVRH
jgi:DNA-3-methyladenine glycosylase I